MASFLAIDWDPPNLRVLAVTGGRGQVHAQQAFTCSLDADLGLANAAAAGGRLREGLHTANIAPAPVVWCVGRDRVILKELLIPPVSAHEEPAIVRFQAAKEFSESPADMVIDYTPLTPPQAGQQTRVLAAALRKSVVQALTVLCQSAGLKLLALCPRPFAAAGLLARAEVGAAIPRSQAVLLATAQGVEFTLFRGDRLAWARTLSGGPGLAGELQRNLVLLAAQNAEVEPVQRIRAAGLTDLPTSSVPIERLVPWRGEEGQLPSADAYLGALGLAEVWSQGRGTPINFASPKSPKPVVDLGKRRLKFGLILAGVLVPTLLGAYMTFMSNKRAELGRLQMTKEKLETEWKSLAQERVDFDAIKDWEESTVSWIDEMYDIAARLPHKAGFRLTQVTAVPLPKRTGKDKYVARLTLHGVMASDQDTLVSQFLEEIHKDPHLRAAPADFRGQEFTLKIDVTAQPPKKYQTRFTPPPPAKTPVAEPEMPPEDDS